MTGQIEMFTKLPKLPVRRVDGHKGDYGRALIVGGSRGMIGAVSLAANAALRGGAGLVTFACPETVQQSVAVLCPCATSVPLVCGHTGEPTRASVRQMVSAAASCDVIALGPGMGMGTTQVDLVRAAIELRQPLVLDADGLNNLVRIDQWPAERQCPVVLTPHPGEMSRLSGKTVADIQADRQGVAVSMARQWACQTQLENLPFVCVLKGAATVVTDGRRVYINDTGNPGMATGGSGDVLTGLVAALIAQGIEPFQAACLAVNIHGRAGDLAAAEFGHISTIATDILGCLPQALQAVGGK